ncbi:GNAT family N-acetyltransferase [Humibacillus sp. DSM 29435]|uniref:GNAT family N-acetyltransferase n=1 Tax=Humibacillus sp. DSM 29435 TaxID=1869167 RepID=UPI0009F4453C|nr:GNAT family N-acetyltransferase [Humibacillus sp. DSM 29435]
MPESEWRITSLVVADCDELGRVHTRIWRETYAGLMPAGYLADLSETRSAENWRRRIVQPEGVDAGSLTLVARRDGHIVGFASAGPSRDADAPTEWELHVINLLQTVQGSGLAELLLDRVLGERDATLWVVEGNARARAFYTRRGFTDEGGRSAHEPTDALEMRMVRRGTPD